MFEFTLLVDRCERSGQQKEEERKKGRGGG
jgi:hypothetical protein